MIPVFDVLGTYKKAQREILKAIKRVLESGNYILGPEVKAFEKEFAEATGNKYCVGCASGTDAISLSLLAIGIRGVDNVLTTSFTAFPTVVGIERAGARAIIVDCKKDALINPEKIEEKITSRTRAILPVHLFSQYCNMKEIMRIAKKYKLKVIEDCAQRTFTKIQGIAGAYSFYPTKTLGAFGDAGAVCTNSKEIYEKIKALRDYGQTQKNVFTYPGLNSRMDEIHAAVLRVKLKHKIYMGKPVYMKCLNVFDRDLKIISGANRGFNSLIHYPYVVNAQKAFRGQKKEKFPMANEIKNTILTMPPSYTFLND